MKQMIGNMEEVLNRHVSGFHQYVLTPPIHVSFASENLCGMLGYAEDELLSEGEDRYALLVHPGDRAQYSDFIHQLSLAEQTCTLQYRIVKKNGDLLYVSDTLTSKRLEDGTLVGDSVLTDITQLKAENDNLQFLNATIPCGFLKYTCEKHPKITYFNDQMLKMLRFPEVKDGEIDYLELCKENIFLMIPTEERRRFAFYLDRVYRQEAPIAGEITVLRCDGTKMRMFGWVTKCTNEQGVEEYQSVCMDITERYRKKKQRETERYLKALSEVYDKIFEYDLSNNTVKCLYGQSSAVFRWLENIPMQMEDATERWIMETVCKEDLERVRAFFADFYCRKLQADVQLPQIKYRAQSSSGKQKTYTGTFLKISESISLFCCRNVPDAEETDTLRSENASLKNVQELVMRFSDGVAAFEVRDENVTPLYASDNVCEFFGFTKEEWLPMMKKSTPIKTFVARSAAAYEDFVELLENGEAEFTYFDLNRGTERRIKAICSQKSPSGAEPRYIMLYKVDEMARQCGEEAAGKPSVCIRTFGYFDVFVDDKPIAFRNEKSKELFALLVDRRGGFITSDEAISFLWEDETVNSVTLSRYRKVALRLKNILEEYGISDVVESVNGKRRLVTDRVQCDLYDYLSGKEEYAQLFKGSYLTNYSWGETTLAGLMGNSK